MSDALHIRPVTDQDLPAVLTLCARALSWSTDARHQQLFVWKHLQNPFGRSEMWGAWREERLIGFRAMLRWKFVHPDGTEVLAVRAIDTATDPDFRGGGVFSRLTLHAVEALTREGFSFVFNTPNAMSRPGYLKLGWSDAGRVPIVVMPRGVGGVLRMLSARTSASKWSSPLALGSPGVDPEQVLRAAPRRGGLATLLTREFLDWRFNRGPVDYRTVSRGGSGAVVRARRRGNAEELVVELVWGHPPEVKALLAQTLRESPCHYAVATATTAGCESFIPTIGIGPQLTLRPLARQPPAAERLSLVLGDIELF